MYIIVKAIISAIIIVIVSEIAKKSSWAAAIIVSIPLTSLLAYVWIYYDTKNYEKIIDLSYSTIIMTIPSFVFFIILPIALKLKYNFLFSILISVIGTAMAYLIFIYLIKKINISF